jgi:DNA-binding PadR family transcriptional regulator
MEIDNVLLGLIKLNKEVTGYELNGIIRDSNQYFLAVSLAYIYPVLKKLHQRGLVTYTNIPITNRPAKKVYQITPLGEQVLQKWLKTPVEPDMYFRSFLLKMEFASLMDDQTLLDHIEREIARLEDKISDLGQLSNCINSGKLDSKNSEMLSTLSQLLNETDALRIKWLKEWKSRIEKIRE